MKTKIIKYAAILLFLAGITVSCAKKESKDPSVEQEELCESPLEEEFCLCDTLTIPVINQFLAEMNDDLVPPPLENDEYGYRYSEYEKQKLWLLYNWLHRSCDKISYSRFGCYACMSKGYASRSSRLVVMADENDKTKDYLLEIDMGETGMGEPLEVVSWYSRLGCDCKDELFYYSYLDIKTGLYYSDQVKKFFFDDRELRNDCLIVGFFGHVQDAEMVDYINRTGFFKPACADDIFLRASTILGFTYEYHAMYVELKCPQRCSKLKDIIRALEKSPMVAYASLAFEGGETSQWELSLYTDIFASSYFFRVTVKDSNDLSDLYALMQETNTWIVDHAFSPYFFIGANKNSKGNALEMANYFWKTGKFICSYPYYFQKIKY